MNRPANKPRQNSTVQMSEQASEQAAPEQHGPDVEIDKAGEETGGAIGRCRCGNQEAAEPGMIANRKTFAHFETYRF